MAITSATAAMTELRIVHAISSAAAGGAEILVRDLAIEQARIGHRPAIAFVSHSTDIGRSDDFTCEYLATLEQAQIPYAFLGHECRRNPLLGYVRLRRFLREHGAEIYHSHLKYALVFGAFAGIPHVHTHHNERRHVPAWMWPLFSSRVDTYVGVSDFCADRLRIFSGRTVTTIRNAIDTGRITGGAVRIGSLPVQAVAIGSPTRQKNYELLIEAVALLPPAKRRGLSIEIIGEGPPGAAALLLEGIEARGLCATIRLGGPHINVSEALSGAHLFVLSSAWEGLPIALIEATVSGLGFLSTDVGGCREIADLCGNGIIVPKNDPAAFAAALESLIDAPQLLETLSANALANAHLLSITQSAERHIELYESLLRRRAGEARPGGARSMA